MRDSDLLVSPVVPHPLESNSCGTTSLEVRFGCSPFPEPGSWRVSFGDWTRHVDVQTKVLAARFTSFALFTTPASSQYRLIPEMPRYHAVR